MPFELTENDIFFKKKKYFLFGKKVTQRKILVRSFTRKKKETPEQIVNNLTSYCSWGSGKVETIFLSASKLYGTFHLVCWDFLSPPCPEGARPGGRSWQVHPRRRGCS